MLIFRIKLIKRRDIDIPTFKGIQTMPIQKLQPYTSTNQYSAVGTGAVILAKPKFLPETSDIARQLNERKQQEFDRELCHRIDTVIIPMIIQTVAMSTEPSLWTQESIVIPVGLHTYDINSLVFFLRHRLKDVSELSSTPVQVLSHQNRVYVTINPLTKFNKADPLGKCFSDLQKDHIEHIVRPYVEEFYHVVHELIAQYGFADIPLESLKIDNTTSLQDCMHNPVIKLILVNLFKKLSKDYDVAISETSERIPQLRIRIPLTVLPADQIKPRTATSVSQPPLRNTQRSETMFGYLMRRALHTIAPAPSSRSHCSISHRP